MSRTPIVLDDKLVAKCRRAAGIKTLRALIHHAPEELLRQENPRKIVELKEAARDYRPRHRG